MICARFQGLRIDMCGRVVHTSVLVLLSLIAVNGQ